MGSQRVKNISRPIRVWQWTPDAPTQEEELAEEALHQRVQFATAPDGVQIAWASIGEGTPVLKAPNWLNHLEYEWRSPVWRPSFSPNSRNIAGSCGSISAATACRTGRWRRFRRDAMIGDMSTVVARRGARSVRAPRHIAGLRLFNPLCGRSIPEQVTCLVLLGGYLRGRLKRPDPEQKKLYEALDA